MVLQFDSAVIRLREIFRHSDLSGTSVKVGQVLEDQIDLGAVQSEVGAILSDSVRLLQAVQESYFHDNGFLKFFLARESQPDFRVRLHIWPVRHSGNREFVETNVHNHTRKLWSKVLAGKVGNDIFEVMRGDGEWIEHRLGIKGLDTGFEVKETGTARLQAVSRSDYAPGSTYSLAAHVLHRVRVPTNALTATLFVQGPISQAHTTSYSREVIQSSEGFREIPAITRHDFVRNLEQFLALSVI